MFDVNHKIFRLRIILKEFFNVLHYKKNYLQKKCHHKQKLEIQKEIPTTTGFHVCTAKAIV